MSDGSLPPAPTTPDDDAALGETALLPTADIPVSALDNFPTLPVSPLPEPVGPAPNQVFLYLPGVDDPLVIEAAQFILGRTLDQKSSNVVDLSSYRGYVLGVSRHHALISCSQGNYSIKDLGSANGTWLNGTPLSGFVAYSLADGDQIQLGRFVLTFRVS